MLHFIMIKGLIHLNVYAHSNRASKSMVCILVEEEGDIGNSTFIVDISYISLGN